MKGGPQAASNEARFQPEPAAFIETYEKDNKTFVRNCLLPPSGPRISINGMTIREPENGKCIFGEVSSIASRPYTHSDCPAVFIVEQSSKPQIVCSDGDLYSDKYGNQYCVGQIEPLSTQDWLIIGGVVVAVAGLLYLNRNYEPDRTWVSGHEPDRTWVSGHWRTLPDGSKTWVSGHWRTLPDGSKTWVEPDCRGADCPGNAPIFGWGGGSSTWSESSQSNQSCRVSKAFQVTPSEYYCTAKVVNVQADDVLNIRSKPHYQALKLGSYPSDFRSVQIKAILSNGWASTNRGFVNSKFLECID